MSVTLSLPVIEAAVFTMGCALIHAQRRHAERITRLLMFMLYLVTMVLALGSGLDQHQNAMTAASATAEA